MLNLMKFVKFRCIPVLVKIHNKKTKFSGVLLILEKQTKYDLFFSIRKFSVS